MPRKSAATVQTPGAFAGDADPTATSPESAVDPAGVAAAAEAARVEDAAAIDPATLERPVFVAGEGWLCPEPKTEPARR